MDTFGPWNFKQSTRELTIDKEEAGEGQERYAIDLDRCTTSAEVLDWIIQVAGKSWATDCVLASLIRALQYYLHPQQTLCSGGNEQGPIDVKEILRTHKNK